MGEGTHHHLPNHEDEHHHQLELKDENRRHHHHDEPELNDEDGPHQGTDSGHGWAGALPQPQGLYHPDLEKDACGVGFTA